MKIVDYTPITVCARAIRNCHDTHDKSDNGGPLDKALIKRVGVKMKHRSVLEHLTFIVRDIDNIKSFFEQNPYSYVKDFHLDNDKTIYVKTNMRVIIERMDKHNKEHASETRDRLLMAELLNIIPDQYKFLLKDKK